MWDLQIVMNIHIYYTFITLSQKYFTVWPPLAKFSLANAFISPMHTNRSPVVRACAAAQTNRLANTIITCFPDTPRNSGGDAGETSACADCVIRERKLQSACSEEEDEKG